MEKFTKNGIHCAVNVDPIVALITDSRKNIKIIISLSRTAGKNNVYGAFLRLRFDIWCKLKLVFTLLN